MDFWNCILIRLFIRFLFHTSSAEFGSSCAMFDRFVFYESGAQPQFVKKESGCAENQRAPSRVDQRQLPRVAVERGLVRHVVQAVDDESEDESVDERRRPISELVSQDKVIKSAEEDDVGQDCARDRVDLKGRFGKSGELAAIKRRHGEKPQTFYDCVDRQKNDQFQCNVHFLKVRN